jgi:hypothetical protein
MYELAPSKYNIGAVTTVVAVASEVAVQSVFEVFSAYPASYIYSTAEIIMYAGNSVPAPPAPALIVNVWAAPECPRIEYVCEPAEGVNLLEITVPPMSPEVVKPNESQTRPNTDPSWKIVRNATWDVVEVVNAGKKNSSMTSVVPS